VDDARRRRLLFIAIGGGAAIVLAWLAGKATVRSVASGAMSERGFVCAPVSVSVAWDLGSVALAPTRCAIRDGQVSEVRFPGGIRAFLRGTEVHRVVAPALEVTLREDPPLDVSAFLEGEEQVVPAPLRRALDGVAELAARDDLPSVSIERVFVRRLTHSVTLRSVRFHPSAGGAAIRVGSAGPPPMRGRRASVEGAIVDLHGVATATQVSFTGRIEVEAHLGDRELAETIPFRLRGEGLGTSDARYSLWVHPSERLERLRVGLDAMRARRQARRERIEGAGERLRALRDRLRDTRERLEAE
jgi:hypothetical protein